MVTALLEMVDHSFTTLMIHGVPEVCLDSGKPQ